MVNEHYRRAGVVAVFPAVLSCPECRTAFTGIHTHMTRLLTHVLAHIPSDRRPSSPTPPYSSCEWALWQSAQGRPSQQTTRSMFEYVAAKTKAPTKVAEVILLHAEIRRKSARLMGLVDEIAAELR